MLPAQQAHHPVVDQLHELLAGRHGAQDLLAQRILGGLVHEPSDHAEVHIRLEKGDLDLVDRVLDVLLGDVGLAADLPHEVGQLAAQFLKHSVRFSVSIELANIY